MNSFNLNDLTPSMRLVLSQLEIVTAKKKTIPAKDIADKTGLPTRAVGNAIKQMRERHGVPIFEDTTATKGYALCRDNDDLVETLQPIQFEATSKLATATALMAIDVSDFWHELAYQQATEQARLGLANSQPSPQALPEPEDKHEQKALLIDTDETRADVFEVKENDQLGQNPN